ncbi:MAG: hypothetical protein R2883_04620 [Caldisericia bacterium]
MTIIASLQNNPFIRFVKKHSSLIIAFLILGVLASGLIIIQFRYPLALNMDGGNNAANVQALMNFKKMPFQGPQSCHFFFGYLWISLWQCSCWNKIVSTISIVMVGWLIFDFLRKVTEDDVPAFAGLLGWCVSLGVLVSFGLP